MRLERLAIENYGPFRRYEIDFPPNSKSTLITGTNNQGKSSIINALRLVGYATKVFHNRNRITLDHTLYYRLLRQDIQGLQIERLVHNYQDVVARITATFDSGFIIHVYIDPFEQDIYATFEGKYESEIKGFFGFVPPLGTISEVEEVISSPGYLRANIFTSLAPRHTRNYLYQLLDEEDNRLVRQMFNDTWQGAELLDYEIDYAQNRLYLFFSERGIDREISWAGQGLQIWLQIIIHIVLNKNTSLLVLDEPEIGLHPEKQHDLLRMLQEVFAGDVLLATHSVEMIDSVDVDNIVFVEKHKTCPAIKSTRNREFLNSVRQRIGSNFNLIVSQFDDHDLILFTENKDDYKVYMKLIARSGFEVKVLPIAIDGFQNYTKCIHYYEVFKMLMGRNVRAVTVLDRDYYPAEYLAEVKQKLERNQIRAFFTPYKELENFFVEYEFLCKLACRFSDPEFDRFYQEIKKELYLDAYANMISRHKAYYKGRDEKTIIKDHSSQFLSDWETIKGGNRLIQGKKLLAKVRNYAQTNGWGANLSLDYLARVCDSGVLKEFIADLVFAR